MAPHALDQLGVRGPHSAVALLRNGFRNVVPIGCPSIFWNLEPALRLAHPGRASNPLCVYHRSLVEAWRAFADLPRLGQDFQDEALFTRRLDGDLLLHEKNRRFFAAYDPAEVRARPGALAAARSGGGARVTIVLADDRQLVRQGLRALLEALAPVSVVAETGDGREALELIERHRPSAAQLDITIPGLNGLEVAERVARISPETRIVILSMHASEAYVAQALRAGVAGYLLKDSAEEELGLALAAVSRGERYLSPAISRHVVQGFLDGGARSADPLAGLTARQREILQLLAEGHSAKEIAYRLGISAKTVETHRAQPMERVGIHDLPGLVRLAIRAGLISPDA